MDDTSARCSCVGQAELLAAAKTGNHVRVEQLIHQGVDVNYKNKSGIRSVHLAAGFGNDTVLELLKASGADLNAVTPARMTAAHYAASNGRIASLHVLHRLGASLHAKDRHGRTPLGCAQTWCKFPARPEVVQVLLELQAVS